MNICFDKAFMDMEKDILKIRCDEKEILLNAHQIIFFESFNKTVVIHTFQTTYMVKAKIGDIYNYLHHYGFIRIHKSYVVNIGHIKSLKNYIVTLSDGKQIHASQRRWKHIKNIYKDKNTACD